MDQITNLYKNRAEALLEQVNFLENKLKNLQEQEKTEPKYGRGKKAGFGASGSVFGEEEIDYTGGNIDPKTGAWSASSGGAAIADTEAGDTEIKERMRKIAKGGGIFEKGVEKTEQTAAYKEMAGELERRRQAREAAKSGVKTVAATGDKGGTQKVPGTEAPSGRVAKQPMQIPDSGKIAVTPPTGPAGTGGPGDTSRAPARPQPMAQPTVVSGQKQDDNKQKQDNGGIDPKLVVLGLAGAAYGGKKVYDYYARQRGGAAKVQEPAKPTPKAQEPAKPTPKAQEPAKPTPKVQEPAKPAVKVQEPVVGDGSYSTKEGKIVTPKKTAPTVAERAALGRDLLRARMAQRTQEVPEPKYGQQKPAAEAKPNVPETQVKPGDMSTKGGQVVSKGSQVSSKVGKLMKGGAGVAGSIGAALGGEMAVEKGLEALGVENEHIKGVVAPTVGWAAGEGVLTTALGLARGVGMGAALAAGGAAAVPAAVYGALAYPSYKAAEASQAAMEKEAERIKRTGSATKAKFIGPKY